MQYSDNNEVPHEDDNEISQPQEPIEESTSKKGFGLLLKIAIPTVAVLAIIAAAILGFVRAHPLAVVSRATINLQSEAMERINTTPLRVLAMAFEKLENGTLTLNFEYSDRWDDIEATATLISNRANRAHFLEFEIADRSDSFKAEVFLTQDSLAVGSTLVDDNLYGITFSTFREDIRTFGAVVDMDEETMDSLADMVELLEMLMNTDGLDRTALEPYIDMMTDFIRALEVTSERTQIRAGGENVSVRRIEFIIDADDIGILLTDIVETMRDDDALRDFYNLVVDNEALTEEIAWMLGMRGQLPSYDEFVRDLGLAARTIRRDLSGDIAAIFYIGSRDRIFRMAYEVDLRFSGERIRIDRVLDFGRSARDNWTFTANMNVFGDRTSSEMVWDFRERSNRVINNIIWTNNDRWGEDIVMLQSVWSKDSGRFALSYDERWSSGEISGILTYGRNGFRLAIDNPFLRQTNTWFDFELIGTTDNQIRSIDFINIDRWTQEMLEEIDEALIEAGFGSFSTVMGPVAQLPQTPDLPLPPAVQAPPPAIAQQIPAAPATVSDTVNDAVYLLEGMWECVDTNSWLDLFLDEFGILLIEDGDIIAFDWTAEGDADWGHIYMDHDGEELIFLYFLEGEGIGAILTLLALTEEASMLFETRVFVRAMF